MKSNQLVATLPAIALAGFIATTQEMPLAPDMVRIDAQATGQTTPRLAHRKGGSGAGQGQTIREGIVHRPR